jgi:hypothetical protein
MLGPELQHNIEETARLVRIKRLVVVAALVCVILPAPFVADEALIRYVIGVFVLVGAAFSYLTVKVVLVFRRDLRERMHLATVPKDD